MDEAHAKVVDLDLNDILPNRFQPRIKFSEDAIIELSESIKEHGVIQPIIVRPIGDKYEIIAGERRYKASVLAGKDTIPAIISSLNDKDCAEVALIENVQRKDLSAIEEAVSYKKILDMGYLTQEQLAIKLGKSQSAVANKIRLLNLCDEVQEALMEEKISERHARALLKLHEAAKQKEMLDRIINERLTVRKTEEEIEKMNNFINEPNNELNMNNNPTGFPTVNPGFMDVSGEANAPKNDAPVDFSALLMNESEKSSSPAPNMGMNNAPQGGNQFEANGVVPPSMGMPMNNASQGGYQFDANGVVTAEPTPVVDNSNPYGFVPLMPTQPEPTPNMGMNNAPQGGYQFDANGVVTAEPAPSVRTPMNNTPQGGYQFDANGVVTAEPTPGMGMPMNNTPQGGYQFDANGVVTAEPTPSMGMPMNNAPQSGYQFDASGVVTAEPAPAMSAMPQTPIVENPTVATESMMTTPNSSSTFGLNVPEEATMDAMPAAPANDKPLSFNDLLATNSQREAQNMATYFEPAPSTSAMPQTPIVNNQLPGAFVETTPEADEGTEGGVGLSIAEGPKDPVTGGTLGEEKVDIQPIIITDYSKQYDPVLPQSQQPVERIDFKQIINLIRDVNDTIEKCGYKIETEEVDLEDEYQVIFKINKN